MVYVRAMKKVMMAINITARQERLCFSRTLAISTPCKNVSVEMLAR